MNYWKVTMMPPNTISDTEMAALQRRAQKAQKESMFSKRQVAKRLASNNQQKKALWS